MNALSFINKLLTPTIKIELLYLIDVQDISLDELKISFFKRELPAFQALWQLKRDNLVKCYQQQKINYCLTKKGQELVDLLKY